jgi:hypothetical protein
MPILHFRITSATQTINITRPLHSQNFTFRRAVIVKTDALDMAATYKGGCAVQLSFLQGDEFVSNQNTNQLVIPFDYTKEVNDVRFEFPLASEDVRSAFTCNVKNYDRSADAVVGVPPVGPTPQGTIRYIDLYFSFTSLAQTQNLY